MFQSLFSWSLLLDIKIYDGKGKEISVSILVYVEFTSRPETWALVDISPQSFNPCFRGVYFSTFNNLSDAYKNLAFQSLFWWLLLLDAIENKIWSLLNLVSILVLVASTSRQDRFPDFQQILWKFRT